MSATQQDVLEVWFGDRSQEPDEATRKRWFSKDEEFDAMLRARFGDTLEDAKAGKLDQWAETAEGALALIILLDQLGRNIHRGTPEMYAGDDKALAIATQSLERGDADKLRQAERHFLFMPLMHSEDLEHQDRCVRLFEEAGAHDGAKFANKHRDIVARFGRFPHRNKILGRESTAEELEFLKQPGSSF